VLQVSSDEGGFLEESARQGAAVHLVARVERKPVEAVNVTARLAGADGSLPPLVVMTPRSGWWTCASERGGGIACWLELMRELKTGPLARDVVFVASSGHELGHLGINAFVDRRPGIVLAKRGLDALGRQHRRRAGSWQHGSRRQTTQLEKMLADAMAAAGLAVTRRVPGGPSPVAEAEVVHRGGGRYVSVDRAKCAVSQSRRSRTGIDRSEGHLHFVDVFVASHAPSRRAICDLRHRLNHAPSSLGRWSV
jgi:hypothetical protein